jgi:nitrile hydratase beta subunit
MNGVHDLGGLQDFGPILPEADEPIFHADWERRALALTLAMGATGQWTLDQSRHCRESLPPAQYLGSSYYEIWIAGLERLMLDRGLVTAEELASGRMSEPAKPVTRVLAAADVSAALARGGPVSRAPSAPARFSVGDAVVARNMHPRGHTRLPRYVRGHAGTIARVHGCHVFPDANAHGLGERPQWLYSVRFSARDLWGEAPAGDGVHLDLWEPYLEPA